MQYIYIYIYIYYWHITSIVDIYHYYITLHYIIGHLAKTLIGGHLVNPTLNKPEYQKKKKKLVLFFKFTKHYYE